MNKATLSVSLLALAAAGFVVLTSIPAKAGDTPTATGVNLSFAQLLALAQDAGFEGQDAFIAAAIALAESYPPGNPMSYNPETAASGGTPQGLGSFGLWQIYLKAHPEFTGFNLYDPAQNAMAAYQVYLGADSTFTPWSTFNSGKYRQYLPA